MTYDHLHDPAVYEKRQRSILDRREKSHDYLQRFAEATIEDVLEEFPSVDRVSLFTAKDRETSMARRIALLFLHELVLNGRGQRELAAFAGMSSVTICIVIEKIRDELRWPKSRAKDRLENAAHVAGVPVEFFQRDAKKKRPRPL